MYAIIATGGKQYKVSEGDIITIEKLGVEAGEKVTFDQVLVVGGDDLKVGDPTVAGATVEASVVKEGRAKRLSFTSIREKPDITKRTDTDRLSHRLRLKKLTDNDSYNRLSEFKRT